MKRKIKIWNKINLFETSVVGIAAYPDAHMGVNPDSFSLIKALKSGFVEETQPIDIINCKEANTMTDDKDVSKSEVEKKVEVVEKKEDMSEIIAKAVKEGMKEILAAMPVERGLVSTETEKKVQKSLGELALEIGLFQTK